MIGVLALLALAGGWLIWLPREKDLVLRMGADNFAPYYTLLPDGSVQGLAVDILNESARRNHIKLVWIPVTAMYSEEAFKRRIVDAWPLLTRTPEREKELHFTKPWLQTNFCILSRKESQVDRRNMAGVSIGITRARRLNSIAGRFFPQSPKQVQRDSNSVVQAVCAGKVDAGFLDAQVLDAALLERPAGCETASFRVQYVPEASTQVSIVSIPSAATAADRLRAGISPLVTDGTFSAALDRWAGFSAGQTRSYFELRESEVRRRAYFFALLLAGAAAFLLSWQISRKRAAQRGAERALSAAADSEARFLAFMDHSPLAGFVKEENGRLLYVNRRFSEVFGRTAEEYLGKDDFELWPPEVAAELRKNDLMIMAENRSIEIVESVPSSGGTLQRWLSLKFPFSIGGAKFVGGLALDITERERAEEALRNSEERFRSAFAHATVGMALRDSAGRFLQVNPAFCQITGYSEPELLPLSSILITHPDDRQASLDLEATTVEQGLGDYGVEKRYLRKDGTVVWVRARVGIVRDVVNGAHQFISLVEDISKERASEEAALISEQRWQLALQGTNDGVWDWDARTDSVFFSHRWKEMLGFEDSELPNRPESWEQLVHPQDLDYAKKAVQMHLDKLTPNYSAEYRMRCKDGRYKWVLARGKAIWDADGEPMRLIGAHADIDERKGAEEQLLYQARHDALTGLANRRYFLSRLDSEITDAHVAGEALCLCICDIDRFKSINDRHGHLLGDEVLATFGALLQESVRRVDVAGRMGGDEFYVLLPQTSVSEAAACLERVRERLQTVAFGTNAGVVFGVTASFGIAELSPVMTAVDIIEAADQALYTAKERGRNIVHSMT